jgi:hypothetical protein
LWAWGLKYGKAKQKEISIPIHGVVKISDLDEWSRGKCDASEARKWIRLEVMMKTVGNIGLSCKKIFLPRVIKMVLEDKEPG